MQILILRFLQNSENKYDILLIFQYINGCTMSEWNKNRAKTNLKLYEYFSWLLFTKNYPFIFRVYQNVIKHLKVWAAVYSPMLKLLCFCYSTIKHIVKLPIYFTLGRKSRNVVSTTCLTQNWNTAIKVCVRLPDRPNSMLEV